MISYVALALSVVALCFGTVSLVAHWLRGKEHPDVTTLRAEVLDMLDKVEHWMKRDRIRKLRESHEPPTEEAAPGQELPAADPKVAKALLRAQIFGRR